MKKVYWSADKGIDISGTSRDLLPEMFEKIFITGYSNANPIWMTNNGLDVTLFYQEDHQYEVYHVISIVGSGTSLDGEHRIRSKTNNTITFKLPAELTDFPSTTNGMITKVASLGWTRVYNQFPVSIYKFKHIDGSDMFMRLVFQQPDQSSRTYTNICIGKTWDPATGFINDTDALPEVDKITTASYAQPHIPFSYNNFTAAVGQRYSAIASVTQKVNMCLVGDIYSFLIGGAIYGLSNSGYSTTVGVIPIYNNYNLTLPTLILNTATSSTTDGLQIRCFRDRANALYMGLAGTNTPGSSWWLFPDRATRRTMYLAPDIDPFNGQAAVPLHMVDEISGHAIGILKDLYRIYNTASSWMPAWDDGTYVPRVMENSVPNQSPIAYFHAYPYSLLTIPIDD